MRAEGKRREDISLEACRKWKSMIEFEGKGKGCLKGMEQYTLGRGGEGRKCSEGRGRNDTCHKREGRGRDCTYLKGMGKCMSGRGS